MFQIQKAEKQPLHEDDILRWIDNLNLGSELIEMTSKSKSNSPTKFAFIIHPLGRNHLYNHKLLKYLKPFSGSIGGIVEPENLAVGNFG